jgi:hypothetical protein
MSIIYDEYGHQVFCTCCENSHSFDTINVIDDRENYFVLKCPETGKTYYADYVKVITNLEFTGED